MNGIVSNLTHAITLQDLLIFGFVFCAFSVIFLAIFITRGMIQKILTGLCFVSFILLPFGVIYISNEFVNKVQVEVTDAKKLMYSNTFLLSGSLKNEGLRTISKCVFSVYLNNLLYIKPPAYKIEISSLSLKKGEILNFNELIDNFNDKSYEKIIVECR